MECFKSVCSSLNISENISSDWISRLDLQYSEKNRFYHNLQMLDKKMELMQELGVESQSLILACIFQYFHFDAKRDKKDENCDAFKLFVDQAGIKDSSLVDRVLVLLQDSSTDDKEIEIFHDLDLAVLGASPEEYKNYCENVSREYASEEYQKDRLKMLKTLLTIPFIFSNEKLREKLEKSARINIQHEIDSIDKVN